MSCTGKGCSSGGVGASSIDDIEDTSNDVNYDRIDVTDELASLVETESDPDAKYDAETDETADTVTPLRHDTDLAKMYGDHFREITVDNPYFKLDLDTAKKMNRVVSPDEIPLPVHSGSSKLDLFKLRAYMSDILKEHETDPLTPSRFEEVSRKVAKKHGTMFKKIDLYYIYCVMCREQGVLPCDKIRGLLQINSFRSQSGVMVYSVFTHPFYKYGPNGKLQTFSCKFNCRYCTDMPSYPRSYTPGQPGNDKAHTLGYDTVKQVHCRASAYTATGHVNDKAEVIVLGGTWHSYPLKYRRMFITLLYYAFNTVHENRDRPVGTMEEEIRLNESSKCRVIGLTIETRPDQITPKELIEMRKMGITRVQLGVQHTNIRVLNRVQRRCTPEDAVNAIRLLKDACFKVDIHLMPDLPKPFTREFEEKNKTRLNSKDLTFTKEDIDWNFDSLGEDEKMFENIFESGDYDPDQVKLYPCEVVPYTGIEKDFKEGKHIPYGTILPDQDTNDLIELLIRVMANVPEECRVNRIIRDIPESYVMAGIKDTSGRQRIERMMTDRGLKSSCMRAREIKKKSVNPADVKLVVTHRVSSQGDEYFLQYVTSSNELVGFLRLRLSKNAGCHLSYRRSGALRSRTVVISELVDTALIRELHVYGETVQVNREEKKTTDRTHQHAGFGTRLLVNAFAIAKSFGYEKMAVISGEGVKPYYRRFGFYDGELYLLKDLKKDDPTTRPDAMIEFTPEAIVHKEHRVGQNVYGRKSPSASTSSTGSSTDPSGNSSVPRSASDGTELNDRTVTRTSRVSADLFEELEHYPYVPLHVMMYAVVLAIIITYIGSLFH
ncbi:putative histone acethyltransferase [Yasminevirus sp. GU-2018]|uniref:tRNA carboxymethyluridine synthase n=1 Tax=Yasminevirus sp. GU-2018 TaxID=2420051 RepID=A0A5K0UAJ0_9VIRU|nr:putative histone acethyltransferase [Yasminevirus sp. GU-2018]